MHTTKKQKQEEIKKNLQLLITDFFERADIMSCIDAVTYLAFSIDEEVDPLTSMDNVNLRSLMRLLVDLARLKTEEGIPV